jgi:hypothetical protein
VFEVDSSWGAGDLGSPNGGVRRDTWLFNEGTKKWAEISPDVSFGAPSSPRFRPSSTDGPYNENLNGLYRFR